MQLNHVYKNGASNISFSCHLFPARSAHSQPFNSVLSTINEHTYGHGYENVTQTSQRELSVSGGEKKKAFH